MNEIITVIKENFTQLYILSYVLPLLAAIVYFFRNKNSFIYSMMFQKKLRRISPKPGSVSYKLAEGRLECYQKELTLKEDAAIISLLENFSFDEIKEGRFKVNTLISFLIKENALEKFLRIILHIADDVPSEIVTSLTNSELQVIFQDFFTLNPGAMQILNGLLSASAFTNMMNIAQQNRESVKQNSSIEQKK